MIQSADLELETICTPLSPHNFGAPLRESSSEILHYALSMLLLCTLAEGKCSRSTFIAAFARLLFHLHQALHDLKSFEQSLGLRNIDVGIIAGYFSRSSNQFLQAHVSRY